MSELKERYDKCNSLEKFIWDRIAVSCGYFEGIKALSFDDLIVLQAKVAAQITIELEQGVSNE